MIRDAAGNMGDHECTNVQSITSAKSYKACIESKLVSYNLSIADTTYMGFLSF